MTSLILKTPRNPGAIIQPTNRATRGQRINKDYFKAVRRYRPAETWFDLVFQQIPDRLTQLTEREIRERVIAALCEADPKVRTPKFFAGAEIKFTSHPHVQVLTGTKLKMITMEFERWGDFNDLMMSFGPGHSVRGATGRLEPAYFLPGIGLFVPPEARRIGLFFPIVCKEVPSHSDILKHELTHSLDPLGPFRSNPDSLLLDELIAHIGMFARRGHDLGPITAEDLTDCYHLFRYVAKVETITTGLIKTLRLGIPKTNGTRTINGPQGMVIAQQFIDLIKYFTTNHRKTTLTRCLMGCLTFEEVQTRLAALDPGYYQPPILDLPAFYPRFE